MKIISYKDISLAEALELLEKRLSEGEVNENQKKMYEYLKRFSKINAERARELVDKLTSELNLPRSDAVQIVNIMPTNLEELRNILQSDRYYTNEELKKILEIIKE